MKKIFTGKCELSCDGDAYFLDLVQAPNMTMCISLDLEDWHQFTDVGTYVEDQEYYPTQAEYDEAKAVITRSTCAA